MANDADDTGSAGAPRKGGRPPIYDFRSVAVGDRIIVIGDDADRVYRAAHAWGQRHGVTFTTRLEGDVRIITRTA